MRKKVAFAEAMWVITIYVVSACTNWGPLGDVHDIITLLSREGLWGRTLGPGLQNRNLWGVERMELRQLRTAKKR
jgi:hypothetical protein